MGNLTQLHDEMGLEGGRGHKLYEEYRELKEATHAARKRQIELGSKEYYSFFQDELKLFKARRVRLHEFW